LEIVNVNPVVVETEVVTVGTIESGRSVTIDVAADNSAVDDPMLFVAITDTLMYLSISASVNTYVLFVAEPMLEYEPPEVDARFH
jgi:hypothetical protein